MRPLIAACAACISTICIHPIHTKYLQKQLNVHNNIKYPMAGCLQSAANSFIMTGIYFTSYEFSFIYFTKNKIPIATFLGTSSSYIIGTPLHVYTKRIQVTKNNLNIPKQLNKKKWISLYMLNVINEYPKNLLKYLIYEYFLNNMNIKFIGLFAGFTSSLITSIIFEPIEYIKTLKILGLPFSFNNIYNGMFIGITISILSNTIGHGIIEELSPR